MDDAQREVAAIALAAAGEFGFVLAGGNAIAMHGIGERPSEDVDLFTNVAEPDNFRAAVDGVLAALDAAGWHTESRTGWVTFARITASKNNATVSIDMGLDYRASPPATMTIGPVLALRDAAANKMSALYSRGLPRDFLDIDALIASRRFTPAELLGLADDVEASPMDRTLLADRFRLIERFPDSDFTAYGAATSRSGSCGLASPAGPNT